MNSLSNGFSVLQLDVEDDKEEVATVATVEHSGRRSGDTDEQNGELPVKKNPSKCCRAHKEISSSSSSLSPSSSSSSLFPSSSSLPLSLSNEDYKLPLVWIDLEMTGLEVEVDRILEIACIVTNGTLTKSVVGPNLVINQSKECLDNMGEWCREHHAASGLTERVLQSTTTEKDAEKQVINFVKNHVGSQTPLLAGNSIYMDLMFLKKYMPNLASIFHHVLVDVSSITALCQRWFPKEKRAAPAKKMNHRALDDIKESIRELKYYKDNIFKGSSKSKQ